MSYWGIRVCISSRSVGWWEVCALHQRMLLIPGFFGLQPESQLSPRPTLAHIRAWHQRCQRPAAADGLWRPPRRFGRGAFWGRKVVAADGHSWAGLVSAGDSEHDAQSFAHMFVKIPVLNHCYTPPLSSPPLRCASPSSGSWFTNLHRSDCVSSYLMTGGKVWSNWVEAPARPCLYCNSAFGG